MFLLHLLVSHAALSYSPSGARLALGRVARAAAARMDEVACESVLCRHFCADTARGARRRLNGRARKH